MNRDLICHEQERAVDQLVDELSARVWRLRALIDGTALHGDPVARVRTAADELVARMSPCGPGSVAAADQVVAALWADDCSRHISDDWWTTPLGCLVQRVRAAANDDGVSCAPIRVAIANDGEAVTVVLAGEFDLAATAPVRQALEPHLESRVSIDLNAVEFLDSSGLCCLLALRRDAHRRGGHITIGATSQAVRRLAELAGLPPTVFDDGPLHVATPNDDGPVDAMSLAGRRRPTRSRSFRSGEIGVSVIADLEDPREAGDLENAKHKRRRVEQHDATSLAESFRGLAERLDPCRVHERELGQVEPDDTAP